MSRYFFWRPLAGAPVVVLLVGCVIPPPQAQGPEPTSVTLNYSVPVLSAVEPGKETQERDGIRVSAAVRGYTPTVNHHRHFRQVTLATQPGNNLIDVREIPRGAQVAPKEIRFKIKISNRLDRVLRLAGAVVQWQVAGKAVAVDKTGSQELLAGIILPRQEAEFEISGPDWAELADKSTVALFIYDVVTATDGAGNATRRSNFEFLYTLSRQDKQETFPVLRRQVNVSQTSAQGIRARGGSPTGRWQPCAYMTDTRTWSPAELCGPASNP